MKILVDWTTKSGFRALFSWTIHGFFNKWLAPENCARVRAQARDLGVNFDGDGFYLGSSEYLGLIRPLSQVLEHFLAGQPMDFLTYD